jgi:hypothetical protein
MEVLGVSDIQDDWLRKTRAAGVVTLNSTPVAAWARSRWIRVTCAGGHTVKRYMFSRIVAKKEAKADAMKCWYSCASNR